ncbi:MAG: TfoX/Sxy family protein [Phycisphaerales bacterium]|nr:TfoX/Sxy family protein [Phycisphaerales bacterium]
MPADAELVQRVRAVLARRRGVKEVRMFGGVCFTINGHMCCGIANTDLVLRLGGAGAADALDEPHTRPMDFTGRPMRSMVCVDAAGVRDDAALRAWIDRAARFVRTLPPK